MNRDQLLEMLDEHRPPVEAATWLRAEYLRELVSRFNQQHTRKRIGLYQNERVPDNERNLTDLRTRISMIIEYELARISNTLLEELGIDDRFWCYVVANRFPDLEVRSRDGGLSMRIEVKCLQSIAEEKAANFDTLRKDINPHTDFVIVFLWEWCYDTGIDIQWDRAPKILDWFVFHASSLAALRDTYWLNQPPDNLGAGLQGFDLRYAVNCKDGVYSEEERNYGKLLRIWKRDFPYSPERTPVLIDTELEYFRFKEGVILSGFKSLCDYHLPRLAGPGASNDIEIDGKLVGAMSGEYGFFLKSRMEEHDLITIMDERHLRYAVTMNDKYGCSGYEMAEEALHQRFSQKKPKHLALALFHPA